MNSLSFCLGVFISRSEGQCLLGKVFLVGIFFSFSTLNISFHSLLTCKVSAETFAHKLIGVLW